MSFDTVSERYDKLRQVSCIVYCYVFIMVGGLLALVDQNDCSFVAKKENYVEDSGGFRPST